MERCFLVLGCGYCPMGELPMVEADKLLLSSREPHSNQGLVKGSQGKGWRWGAGHGEWEESCRPAHLLFYVALPAFSVKAADWWPEAQYCPQIHFDWVVLGLKEINQH